MMSLGQPSAKYDQPIQLPELGLTVRARCCRHHSNRSPWLRALVLGANDGLVSTAALMMGVGGGTADLATLRLAGVAGMVGGALSMAVRLPGHRHRCFSPKGSLTSSYVCPPQIPRCRMVATFLLTLLVPCGTERGPEILSSAPHLCRWASTSR